ncbi:group II intron maturase-specific domain-containing protein [Citrobacter portucalensis]|uniref:group II intron maturase-specific domain-containing protein n=1 Tax=Citrobacter portucalensis TaxID=1639133 RepID=UPI0030EC375E
MVKNLASVVGNKDQLNMLQKDTVSSTSDIRLITRRVGGQGMTQIAEQMRIYLRGWKSYFRLAQTPKIFESMKNPRAVTE